MPARELAIWGSSDGSIKDTLYSTNSRDAGGNILPINTNGDLFTKLNLQRTPRIVENIEVSVGDRLSIPLGELSEHQGIGHIAGYIVPGSGSSTTQMHISIHLRVDLRRLLLVLSFQLIQFLMKTT